MEDHDYTASSFIVVDREKFESMSRQIEELTRQIETLHMERFGLQRFSTSPSDIRYYSRFPSYEHLMAFWDLIQEATSRMVRVTSGQKNLSTSTSTGTPMNRPTKLLPIDELFLFLNYLSTGSLFEGSTSDKEIFRHSGITSLLTPDMEVMVSLSMDSHTILS
ncbi:unnamed protein product [Gadus morhua 'NCC']